MYLTKLILNASSLEARRLLISPYMLHKAIFRAFPDASEGGPGRVLYRVDEVGGETILLVQSEKEPGWKKTELLNRCLARVPESKLYAPALRKGQVFYFRLRANPTVKRNGKRLGLLKEDTQLAWLKRKAQDAGFGILDCRVIPEGMLTDDKREDVNRTFRMTMLSVRFEGTLSVTEPEIFQKTLEQGIGSAKGFGFGLFSIATVGS